MKSARTLEEIVAARISEATGQAFSIEHRHGAGGGCINEAEVLEGGGRKYFVKLNRAALADMFAAEMAGLQALADTNTIRVPRPIVSGVAGQQAFLVLEHLDLGGRGSDARLGENLAALHRNVRDRHGWWRDNTIGSTPQINRQDSDWVAFWRAHRLGYQLQLAEEIGAPGALLREGERLLDQLPAFFADYRPAASLLHGDLWGGNHGALPDGTPVIFDPAVYYGDRETDLAMTELFGGYSADFYAAYRAAWPPDAGYSVRKTLYNLYHVLNHFNLFGAGYLGQAQQMVGRLLAEV